MYTLVIILVLTVTFLIGYAKDSSNSTHDVVWIGYMTVMTGLSSFAFIMVISSSFDLGGYHQETSQVDLYALRTSDAGGGKFFLGSGQFEQESYYYYMVQVEIGEGTRTFQKRSVKDSRNSTIFIVEVEDLDSPYVEIRTHRPDLRWAINLNKIGKIYTFHVPPGSVYSEFRVD